MTTSTYSSPGYIRVQWPWIGMTCVVITMYNIDRSESPWWRYTKDQDIHNGWRYLTYTVLHLQQFPKIWKKFGTLLWWISLFFFPTLMQWLLRMFNSWVSLLASLECLWKLAGLLLLNVLEACWNWKLFCLSFPPLRPFWSFYLPIAEPSDCWSFIYDRRLSN